MKDFGASLVQCLLCKHEDLTSASRTFMKKLGMVVHVIIQGWELDTGRFLGLTGQPAALFGKLWVRNLRPCLKMYYTKDT